MNVILNKISLNMLEDEYGSRGLTIVNLDTMGDKNAFSDGSQGAKVFSFRWLVK